MKSKVIGLTQNMPNMKNTKGVTSPKHLAALCKVMNREFNVRDEGGAIILNNAFLHGTVNSKGKQKFSDWIKTSPLLYNSSSSDLRTALARALDPENKVITERQAELIDKVYFRGMKMAQIAREEGHSSITISSQIRAGLLRIFRNLDRPDFIIQNTRFDFRRFFNPEVLM
ncbi:MAG: hypothetical protein WCH76_00470 [Candidatus Riflemargulisbacteria bacterium]